MTTDPKKRLYISALIIAVFVGGIFLLWIVFFNRGTVKVIAKAPYSMTISRVGMIPCENDECAKIVAPGTYSVMIQKQGYKDETREINVPWNGEIKEEVSFQFVPVIGQTEKKLADKPKIDHSILNLSAETPIFYNESRNYLAYIKRDPDNFRQTLYMREIDKNKQPQAEQLVTSFVRDLKNYDLSISPNHQKIIALDRTDERSTLYLIDIKAKTRTGLLEYPFVEGIKWFPQIEMAEMSEDFLFDARDKNSLSNSVYHYHASDQKVTKLELKTPLHAIAIMNQDRLIAVTTQEIIVDEKDSEGKIVTLGDTYLASPSDNAPSARLAFIDYSLLANQGRLIKLVSNDASIPDKVELNEEQNTLYFLQNGKVSQLRFRE